MKLLHFQGKFYTTQMLQKDLGNKNVVLETWSIVILIILNVNHPPLTRPPHICSPLVNKVLYEVSA